MTSLDEQITSQQAGTMLVQLGDLHIGADWVTRDPLQSLSATVNTVLQLDQKIDAVLVLGDLAEHGTESEYREAGRELARLNVPVHVAMGNHDDRATLRRQFGLGATPDSAPLQYAVDLGPARLLVLDTTVPSNDHGRLDTESLVWLEHTLAASPDTPTVVAMHHPPLVTGSPAWDRLALDQQSRHQLSETLQRHPQVTRILGAHLHRPLIAPFAAQTVLIAPSTYVQFPWSAPTTIELAPTHEPPGFVAHQISDDGQLISYFQTVTPPPMRRDRAAVHPSATDASPP